MSLSSTNRAGAAHKVNSQNVQGNKANQISVRELLTELEKLKANISKYQRAELHAKIGQLCAVSPELNALCENPDDFKTWLPKDNVTVRLASALEIIDVIALSKSASSTNLFQATTNTNELNSIANIINNKNLNDNIKHTIESAIKDIEKNSKSTANGLAMNPWAANDRLNASKNLLPQGKYEELVKNLIEQCFIRDKYNLISYPAAIKQIMRDNESWLANTDFYKEKLRTLQEENAKLAKERATIYTGSKARYV